MCAKSGTPASSQRNTWRGGRSSISLRSGPRRPNGTVSSRRFAARAGADPPRRHVAHAGVRAPIRRRTDSGQLHCTHGFGPFVSAAAAVTPDPVVVVSSA
jgi:hypothetical protein